MGRLQSKKDYGTLFIALCVNLYMTENVMINASLHRQEQKQQQQSFHREFSTKLHKSFFHFSSTKDHFPSQISNDNILFYYLIPSSFSLFLILVALQNYDTTQLTIGALSSAHHLHRHNLVDTSARAFSLD